MTIVGFNDAIAAKHGYKIISLKSGATVSIKASTLRQLGRGATDNELLNHGSGAMAAPAAEAGTRRFVVTPQSVVYGNCGSSYYYLYNNGYPTWKVLTGYNVSLPVADLLAWDIELHNPNGSTVEVMGWDGFATGPGWQGTDGPPPNISMHGTWSGLVTKGEVILTNGAYCSTGHPADHQAF